jgi:UDP-N-acetylmuramate: L-alanyl-gamma-D-glutamyl-meso-diaminopimelate ligase
MASLAGLLKERGFQVSGSDKDCYPPMSTLLAELAIEVRSPYDPANLPENPALIVVGNALSRGNSELEAVLSRRLPYVSMPEILKDQFLRGRAPLVVAGTHGKTTTSSMAAWILETAGLAPGFLIGGVPLNFERSFRCGTGAPFVVEGDEYDTAFFDKGPKFLHYLPEVAIVGNVEFDHADIYRNADEVERAFRLLVNLVPGNGLLIAGIESPRARRVAAQAVSPVESFAVSEDADWTTEVIESGPEGTKFRIRRNGKELCRAVSRLWGPGSLRNALAASAAAHHLGASPASIGEGLSTFAGVKRRMEVRGMRRGVTVVDDFAHHPTAIRETLQAARTRYPGAKLFAVFEPRSFTSRSRVFQDETAEALALADDVTVAEVFSSSRLPPEQELSEEELVSDLEAAGVKAAFVPNVDQIVSRLASTAVAGSVVLVMSNGGFGGLHQKLLDALQQG